VERQRARREQPREPVAEPEIRDDALVQPLELAQVLPARADLGLEDLERQLRDVDQATSTLLCDDTGVCGHELAPEVDVCFTCGRGADEAAVADGQALDRFDEIRYPNLISEAAEVEALVHQTDFVEAGHDVRERCARWEV
jgi:hypothetical protein